MNALLCSVLAVAAVAIAAAAARGAADAPGPFTVVLGIAQDAGYPQTACRRACCRAAWEDASLRRRVACLAIVDAASNERWIIDATPDFRAQLRALDAVAPPRDGDVAQPALAGILLTHAHIGHYTGLADLGREVVGARAVPVYAMPRMRAFLTDNGPWSQLVERGNIALRELADGQPIRLNERLSVTPLLVPHRGEFSETVGFRIDGPQQSVLYVPDIDKWERWDRSIEVLLRDVDAAYLDGTFFRNGEIPGRDMARIPHPFIEESMARLAPLDASDRAKVRFIHLNHTNPALRGGAAVEEVETAGFRMAREGERVDL